MWSLQPPAAVWLQENQNGSNIQMRHVARKPLESVEGPALGCMLLHMIPAAELQELLLSCLDLCLPMRACQVYGQHVCVCVCTRRGPCVPEEPSGPGNSRGFVWNKEDLYALSCYL